MIEVANDEDARRPALLLRVHLPDVDGLVHVVAQVRRLFDLDADPDAIDTHLARDPLLRPLVRANRGLRVPGTVDPFEIGVRAILGQQVSVAQATRLSGRLVARYGDAVPGIDALGLGALFPTAATLRDAPLDDIGITTTRADAIRAFARGDGPARRLARARRPRPRAPEPAAASANGPRSTSRCGARASGTPSPPLTWACATRSAVRGPTRSRRRPPGTRGGPTRRCTCGARPRRHRHRPVRPHDLYLPRSQRFFQLENGRRIR